MIKYNKNQTIIQIDERLFEITHSSGQVTFTPTKENANLEEIKENDALSFVIDEDYQEEIVILNDGTFIFIIESGEDKGVLYTHFVYNINENKIVWFSHDNNYEDFYDFDDYIDNALKEIIKKKEN